MPAASLKALPVLARQNPSAAIDCLCRLCGHHSAPPAPGELGHARGNTARFKESRFTIWRCPACGTLQTLGEVCYEELYRDYPLQRRRLDLFAKAALGKLLGRLRRCGLRPGHAILDYGCGNGVFLEFLRGRGFEEVCGFDPHVPEYAQRPPLARFDVVVANDVIEHCEDPLGFLEDCLACLKPGGLLYAGTAESEGVNLAVLEPHLMRLHLPYHRTILPRDGLRRLGSMLGLQEIASWTRSYMDTLRPFCSYRFLDEYNAALGHVMDAAFDPPSPRTFLRRPALLGHALLGYWSPSACEPAVAWRKAASSRHAPPAVKAAPFWFGGVLGSRPEKQ